MLYRFKDTGSLDAPDERIDEFMVNYADVLYHYDRVKRDIIPMLGAIPLQAILSDTHPSILMGRLIR